MRFWELHNYSLLLLELFQMLMASKKEGRVYRS